MNEALAARIAKELRKRYVVANKGGHNRYDLAMKSGTTVTVIWRRTSTRYSRGSWCEGKWWLEVRSGDDVRYFKSFDGHARAMACGYIK